MTFPLQALFGSIDREDIAAFTGFMSEDARYRFGNAEPIVGRPAIAASVVEFFESIAGLRHHLLGSWEQDNTVSCHGTVTYTRHDGSTLCIPFADILMIEDVLISDYLIFADASELYAA